MSGFHAATDSDFTSSFHGLGKTKGLNLLRKNDLFSDAFILIGEEANLNERTIKVIDLYLNLWKTIHYGIKSCPLSDIL